MALCSRTPCVVSGPNANAKQPMEEADAHCVPAPRVPACTLGSGYVAKQSGTKATEAQTGESRSGLDPSQWLHSAGMALLALSFAARPSPSSHTQAAPRLSSHNQPSQKQSSGTPSSPKPNTVRLDRLVFAHTQHVPPGMSLLIRWLGALLALLATLAAVSLAGPMPAFDPAVLSLTEGNFTSCTDRGMWLVEFFSPYCPHCKRLAPTWRDLADAERHLQDSSDFHMARVNCIAQGDLCSRNNILGYPSIELFRDGTWAETYEGDRSFDDLDAYIQARAADNRKLIALTQRFSS
ncbi:thioredoxin/protein disulfide isomerase [Moesziomyces antarcticus T-34]|uniref:Thioredoxin/protein disulfide isomerase n=1 Tax=Pseudozyma antarctica (strain T-34) TaxID=1151754 RepID=M9MDN7_PSEA3|nr:thioredoxin/protein disulfide isomerase [Moesziomyces antarcticus T-34]